MHARKADGTLEAIASPPIDEATREFFPGGGGLYSTAPDYLRYHMGPLNVEPLPTSNPQLSNVVDLMPGIVKKWGLTFLINTEAAPAGRSAGSLAWGGLNNTYYWLDPSAKVAGIFMTQILPFADEPVLQALDAFESAVYRVVGKKTGK